MPRFSANLGFLWNELALPDAILAAARAGFDAVECHWPYAIPSNEVRDALASTGLPMLGLNTARGETAAGENGLAALPGRSDDARAAIDQALAYAGEIGAANVHVMAGFASGEAAQDAFLDALRYAAERADGTGIALLIEPLNHHDAPGYFLQSTTQAIGLIDQLGTDAVRLMFDCYHVQIMEGDLTRRLQQLQPRIGHIQFAGVPDRSEPDVGEVSYGHVFDVIDAMGYSAPLGAEYKPATTTEAGLQWLQRASDPARANTSANAASGS